MKMVSLSQVSEWDLVAIAQFLRRKIYIEGTPMGSVQGSVEEGHHLPVGIFCREALGQRSVLYHESVGLTVIDLQLKVLA